MIRRQREPFPGYQAFFSLLAKSQSGCFVDDICRAAHATLSKVRCASVPTSWSRVRDIVDVQSQGAGSVEMSSNRSPAGKAWLEGTSMMCCGSLS